MTQSLQQPKVHQVHIPEELLQDMCPQQDTHIGLQVWFSRLTRAIFGLDTVFSGMKV